MELCAAYLRLAKSYYPVVQPRLPKALRLLKSLYGRRPAGEFGPLTLKACRQRRLDDGAARNYINDIVGQIKLIFKWGASGFTKGLTK